MTNAEFLTFEPGPLDVGRANRHAGFRLDRFEVLNWGTFHKHVWGLTLSGANALLTGEIGSGKSTFVDAIATLLVPYQKLTYNKAAGADARERSPRSYFFGYFKSERGDSGSSTRPVALRDQNSYSVILGRFSNQELDQCVTLAQVFWIKDVQGQPARFYVISDGPLSVAEDFAGFGDDIHSLRRRLRATVGAEIYDSFPPYGAAYRHRFGIENEQAMDLFNQTVSMKAVGNLTDFVRDHMLEPFPVEARIAALMSHFDDLTRAHEAVLRAKDQIGRLTPLISDCDEWSAAVARVEQLRGGRDALRAWFASRKRVLLQKRSSQLDAEIDKHTARMDRLAETLDSERRERDDIKEAIARNGGERIERIKREIALNQTEKERRMRRAESYSKLARAVDLRSPSDEEAFASNQRVIREKQSLAETAQADIQNSLTEATVALRSLRDQHDELDAELRSLHNRRSNIPRGMLELREGLCQATGLKPQTLPFAGELVQVRSEQNDWEGAIERVLHNFALSLLVHDAHYSTVADWVDRTHLGGRLVYFRVREQKPAPDSDMPPASLVRKIEIKADSPFYIWLEAELLRRFSYICCNSLDQFRREPKAITRAGQIKGGGERHEKDDRYRIDDRSRFVLGWTNENKIAVLKKRAYELENRLKLGSDEVQNLANLSKDLRDRVGNLKQLAMFDSFRDLAWQPLAAEIERLEREREALERESDTLRTLERQLSELEAKLKTTVDRSDRERDEKTRAEERREQCLKQLAECEALLSAAPESSSSYFDLLGKLSTELFGEYNLTIESCDSREKDFRESVQARIDAEDKKLARLRERIVSAMQSYRNAYPLETQEVDASVDAATEYREMLNALRSDDLPRFEARFKQLLNENTIREVANFQSQLNRERETIRERIDTINESLRQIDYNPGRYITVEAEPTTDVEVRDFQHDLRACTEGSLTGSEDEEYSEAKFLEVKRIIERFRGRDGTVEHDRRWTRKVADVRQWFTFSASERWREDDSEFEHYTDSGGKSGGQKEKLAYTVLAASLAYQFGLDRSGTNSRSFRFVTIDEAFGRGSDESARYGLELFRRLDLQLLIVTPMQKIHIIEPHVSSVGFVHTDDGRISMLRNLTIEEYRAEREARGL